MLYPLSYEGWGQPVTLLSLRRLPGPTMAAMPGTKVLVVDDDPVILKLLRVNFEMEGYVVVSASDGQQALDMARAEHPDVVLLDVMMPVMDGLDVSRALRADEATRELPIVLVSAKAQASDLERGMDAGADDYITKPFDPLELLDRVGQVLHRVRNRP